MKIQATRYHDCSIGHKVTKHESKCNHLHGHNYRIHFFCEAEQLDNIGRVIDFSVIKTLFCNWLEENWDHKFLIYKEDSISRTLLKLDVEGVVLVDFNPTAENMAQYLLTKIAPKLLSNYNDIKLTKIVIEETRKCSVVCELN